MTAQNTYKPAEQPVFHKVAENLYRLESSGGHYALIKKSGKQFRRSLKTKDRKLADRRLKELKVQIGCPCSRNHCRECPDELSDNMFS